MPPSSRKRNKGKERKAKREADKEENERLVAHRFWRAFCGSNQCNHGRDVMIPDDHPVSRFMDQFYINLIHNSMKVIENLKEIFKSHRHIWNNESYRKLVIDMLIHIGTNMLLREDSPLSWPSCVAQSIIALEHYDGSDDIGLVINKRVVMSKWRDIKSDSGSSRRDCLKFYRKRTSCKCLKKIHLEARKTIPKVGFCWHCKDEMERVALSLCSRCMIEQYCSRECQVAAWPKHKEDCDEYVKANRTG